MAVTEYSEQKILPYSAEQLFDVVADIGAYAEFLPWCVGSRIIDRRGEVLTADLIIGYKFIRECFRSEVTLNRPDKIAVRYISGPLKNLHNSWTFTDLNDGTCCIDFYVAFEFQAPLLKHLVAIFFDEIVKRMVAAFEMRAEHVHGKTDSPSKSA